MRPGLRYPGQGVEEFINHYERRIDMKKLWIAIGLVLVVAVVAYLVNGGSGGQKTAGGKYAAELNFFNWSNYMPQSVLNKFKEQYGIKVNYSTFSSNEEMLAKIQAGGASQYDLAVASDYMVQIMLKQKNRLLQPIDLKNIPNFQNIFARYLNLDFDPDNKFTVPYMCGTALIAVNKAKVKFPIQSYQDLWNPRLKDSLVVLDDQRAIIGMALKKLGYSLNETDPKRLAQAKAELVKLLPNIKAYDSDSPKTLLINGEAAVGMLWSAEASLAKRDNQDIEIVFPEDGMYLWQDNFFIPKGSPHKKEAELFVNFILDPKVSVMISKELPYTNPNEAAFKLQDQKYLSDIAANPPQAELEKGEYLKDVGAATRIFDQIWSEIKQSQ
jgi:spermidine/putrescine transport system permease protein